MCAPATVCRLKPLLPLVLVTVSCVGVGVVTAGAVVVTGRRPATVSVEAHSGAAPASDSSSGAAGGGGGERSGQGVQVRSGGSEDAVLLYYM